MRSSMERKVQTGFAFALACLAALALMSWIAVERLRASTAWVEHTHQVMGHLETLFSIVTEAQNGHRGYALTGDERFLGPYRRAIQAAPTQIRELRQLTADNPAQQQRVAPLTVIVGRLLERSREIIEVRRTQGLQAAQRATLTGLGRQLHEDFRRLIDEMKHDEEALLKEREARELHNARLMQTVMAGMGGLTFAFVGFAFFAIRRDLAGRQRAEAALREARDQLELRVRERTAELQQTSQLLRGIIDSSDDAIISKTLQGIISSWNAGAERIFGYAAHEVIGQAMLMLIPADRAAEEPEFLARIARGERIDHFETIRVRKGGERIDISATLSPITDGHGRIIGVSKIAREITEQKRAQQRVQAQMVRLELLNQITRAIGERLDTRSIFQIVVRTLEEQLPVAFSGICLHDPADNTLMVASVGAASASLATELALTEEASVPIDANGLSQCMRGQLVYEPDISSVPFPFPQRLARGGLRALVAAPLRVESQVFGVLLAARAQPGSFTSGDCEFLRQLSEHVALAAHQAQLYDALQKAYDDLRQTQQAVMQQERLRALGQMASGIAHDINNAISPVTLYTESLLEREPNLSADARRYLETIRRAIDDVAQTVTRMREFYRQREPQLTLAAVDMNRLAQQVVDLTRARWSDMAHQRGIVIAVKTELAPQLPAIMGAENELREALTNLIFNAVDAMPQGGTLTLRTQVKSTSVVVEVLDTGLGMDEDTRRRCLEPFFTTKGDRGTGLGLAMVYGVMQRHSADIEIDSGPGRGTAVRLIFEIPAAAMIDATPSAPTLPLPSALQLLLVDDDPLLLKSLSDILAADGHLPTAAHGGQAGVDAFSVAHSAGKSFDVVITDLGMPYVDGRKVAAAVKAVAPSMPVILLTGWGQRLLTEGDIPAHVDRVLSKPPKLRELREALALLTSKP